MGYIIETILYGARFDEAFGMIITVILQKTMVYSMWSSIKVSQQDKDCFSEARILVHTICWKTRNLLFPNIGFLFPISDSSLHSDPSSVLGKPLMSMQSDGSLPEHIAECTAPDARWIVSCVGRWYTITLHTDRLAPKIHWGWSLQKMHKPSSHHSGEIWIPSYLQLLFPLGLTSSIRDSHVP